MSYIPEQGDIIDINFDPSAGKGIIKRRPAYVLSKKMLNEHVELAIVAPITSTNRGISMEVPLSNTMKTTGVILPYQMRSLDFESRDASFIEKAPQEVIDAVRKIAKLLIS